MLTIIIFIIILGILIFAHELGHFLLAKRNGVKVEEFGFGFPPRLVGIQRITKQTLQKVSEEKTDVRLLTDTYDLASSQEIIRATEIEREAEVDRVVSLKRWRLILGNKKIKESFARDTVYSLNWIPLGGFVKILGEEGEEKNNPFSFAAKKIWQRAVILVAGVAMNFLLAILLLSLGLTIGLPTAIDDEQSVSGAKVQITQVVPQSPAQAVGVSIGDVVKKIKSDTVELSIIEKASQVQNFTAENKGKEILVTLQRGKDIFDVKIMPRENPPAGEGPLGVGLARVAKVAYPWYQALYKAAVDAFRLTWLILLILGSLIWHLVTQGRMVADVLGPVGIYSVTGQAAQMGFIYLVQLTALLSINLAIVNAFPFPALDGGRLIFLLIEKIKGSPVSQKVERALHSAGFVFLIALMILVTVRDVIKLF